MANVVNRKGSNYEMIFPYSYRKQMNHIMCFNFLTVQEIIKKVKEKTLLYFNAIPKANVPYLFAVCGKIIDKRSQCTVCVYG
jgi:hypothetical protein